MATEPSKPKPAAKLAPSAPGKQGGPPPLGRGPGRPAPKRRPPNKPKAGADEPVNEEPEDLQTEEPRRRGLTSEVLRSASAFLTSTIIHVVMLVIFGLWILKAPPQNTLESLVAATPTETEELTVELDSETDAATDTTTASAAAMTFGEAGAEGVPTALPSDPQLDRRVEEEVAAVDISAPGPPIDVPGGQDVIKNVPRNALGDPRQIVEDYDHAMDRITQEILLNLAKSKVLLVWCFDQSESMKDDQEEIRSKIDRVYAELGLTDQTQGDALLTAITSYGSNFMWHTEKPTSNIGKIRDAIDAVPIDPSGKEMMCLAIGRSIHIHRDFIKGRKMMLILVTDETGEREDNNQHLEPAIAEARDVGCSVYVLGREAVFGYPYVHFRWVHPQTGRVHWLPVDRGPETAFPEQLQTDGLRRRYDAHSSGFGPYEQARLAQQTGGIFFMLPSTETKIVRGERTKYDLEDLRPYMPDLRNKQEVKADIQSSILRSGITKVIYDLNPWQEEIRKHIEMRHAFSPRFDEYLQQAQREHQKAKIYFTYLDRAIAELEKLDAERLREYDPRWQANADLIHAQLVSYKARLFEYGAMLEHYAKPQNFPNAPATKAPDLKLVHYDIHLQKQLRAPEQTQGLIDRAAKLFEKVIEKHPGTPWAARAQWEMRRGYGVGLHPDYDRPRRVTGPIQKPPKL